MRGQRAEGEQSGAEGDESSQRGMYKRGERAQGGREELRSKTGKRWR